MFVKKSLLAVLLFFSCTSFSHSQSPEEMCSSVTDESERQACIKTFSKANSGPDFGGWEFSGSPVKKQGESPSFFAHRATIDSVREKPRSGSPFMIFGCSEGKSRLLINSVTYVGNGDPVSVSYWIDRGPETEAKWLRGGSGSVFGVWNEKEASEILNSIKDGREFLVRLDTEYPTYFTFDLKGLPAVMDRVAGVCGWN